MSFLKSAPLIFLAALAPLCALAESVSAATCVSPRIGSSRAPIVSPPLGAVVVGTGRLPFYAAPNPRCLIAGTFVIPDDSLVVYAQTDDGWSSVGYFGAASGGFVDGWVRTARLKMTGEMAPR